MKKTFEEKVKSMSAKEIIMAMVEGLRNPYTKIDMSTFGYVETVIETKFFGLIKKEMKVCYGCAAMNTVCLIENIDFAMNASILAHDSFVAKFEKAIDWLRKGNEYMYNDIAIENGFATIRCSEILPCLRNDYVEAELKIYERLANEQE
jgi:hypothetical protein